jgi:hypothetical protein
MQTNGLFVYRRNFLLEKNQRIEYTLLAANFLKYFAEVSTSARQDVRDFGSAPGTVGRIIWKKEVFATPRCARRDGAGTLRVSFARAESKGKAT